MVEKKNSAISVAVKVSEKVYSTFCRIKFFYMHLDLFITSLLGQHARGIQDKAVGGIMPLLPGDHSNTIKYL